MAELNKKKHFYLIDGSGYIFRAYYALPPLSRKSDGLPTGAVAGFCNMLFKLLEDAKSKKIKRNQLTSGLFMTLLEKISEMIFMRTIKLTDQTHPMI